MPAGSFPFHPGGFLAGPGPTGPTPNKGFALEPVALELGTAPLTNSWIIFIIGLYIALNMTPNIDCYWEGAVPNFGV